MHLPSRTQVVIVVFTTALAIEAMGDTDRDVPRASLQCESEPIELCLMRLAKILHQATPSARIVYEEYASRPGVFSTVALAEEGDSDPSWGIYSPVSVSFTDEPVSLILDHMLEVDGYFDWVYAQNSRTFFVVDKLLLGSSAWVMNATIPSEVMLRDVTLGQALEALGEAGGVKAPPRQAVDTRGTRTIDLLAIQANTSFRFAVGLILEHARPEKAYFYKTFFRPLQSRRAVFTAQTMDRLDWRLVAQWDASDIKESSEDVIYIEWSE
jgi:hypothetical protein